MIFIGKNHNGQIISIVSAKSLEAARAYWQGKDILPHTETQFDTDEQRENEQMGYVTPILVTTKLALSHLGGVPHDFIVIR